MAATKVGIVYNKTNGLIFSFVMPTNDSELPMHVGANQAMLTPSEAQFKSATMPQLQSACYIAAGLSQQVSADDTLDPLVQTIALLALAP